MQHHRRAAADPQREPRHAQRQEEHRLIPARKRHIARQNPAQREQQGEVHGGEQQQPGIGPAQPYDTTPHPGNCTTQEHQPQQHRADGHHPARHYGIVKLLQLELGLRRQNLASLVFLEYPLLLENRVQHIHIPLHHQLLTIAKLLSHKQVLPFCEDIYRQRVRLGIPRQVPETVLQREYFQGCAVEQRHNLHILPVGCRELSPAGIGHLHRVQHLADDILPIIVEKVG